MSTAEILTVALSAALVIATSTYAIMMKRQTDLQKRLTETQILHLVIQRMEKTRGDRRALRDYLRTAGQEGTPLPDEIRNTADRVCREFDMLGLLDRTGLVDQRLVDLFYAAPLVELYQRMFGAYVADLRRPENRGPTHFWELVQFYERVKHVPENHPAVTGKRDWPRDPRVHDAK